MSSRRGRSGDAGAGSALAADLPADVAGNSGPRSERERVAIVGAGGSAAAAYFLAGTFGVDLFEARSKIGGNCDSQVIDYQGQSVTVDLGAQFFHPDTHPIYVTLLEELGLYDPDHPDADETLEAPGSLCIFPTAGGAPIFSSSHPFSTPLRAIQFAIYTQLARQAVHPTCRYLHGRRLDRQPPVRQSFKDRVLYPWITATIGCSRADALQASARSILQTFALAFPANVFQGATTCNLEDRTAGEPAAPAGPQPDRAGAPRHARAGPEAETRRLVRRRRRAGRVLPVRGVERAAACRTRVRACCPPSPT